MTTTKKTRPAKPDSLRSNARRLTGELGFAVTVKMVREWTAKGYPLDDNEKLLVCLSGQQRADTMGVEPKTIADAKLQKLLVDIESARFRLSTQRGEYTRNDLLAEQGRRIGAATRSEVMRFKSDAPTWEGLSAVEIERRMTALIDTICRNLNNALGAIYRK